MNRKYVQLALGIIAMAIVTVLFFLVFVVKSLEPKDQGWYWNTPLIMYFMIFPVYMPFAVVGAVKSAKMIRVKEERSFAIACLVVNGVAAALGGALLIGVLYGYSYWPRLW